MKDYVIALRDSLGPFKDVLAPDGNQFAIAWMHEALARAHGVLEPAAVVGKPAALGGIDQRASAAGGGVFVLLEQALAQRKGGMAGARVAIQGLGSIGASVAGLLYEAGAKIIAVADKSGGLLRESGLDVAALQEHIRDQQFVLGYPDADPVGNAELLELPCDALIAAAAQRQVNLHNAARIRAPWVVEAVHGAVTAGAEKILASAGITVIPDVLGTAAAPIAWFAEWQCGIHFAAPTAQEVEAAVRSRLLEAWQSLRQEAERDKLSLRQAAYIIALRRLAAGMRLL
jgi:glutamate dehydrogenase/leucine dehydrogenase